MSNQIIPYGGSVELSADGTTWAELAECKAIPVPSKTVEYPEVTSLDSPNGYREFITGLKDGGELSFQAGYTSAGYAAVEALDGTLAYIRCTFPLAPNQSTTGDVFTFRGFLSATPDASDVGAPVNMDVAVRVSGAPTFTAGA